MRTRPQNTEDDGGGLDSLLDTMTNVVGILVMYMMSRRSSTGGDEGRGPPMPPGRTPPPPPPEPPTDGSGDRVPSWEEY